MILYFSGTGNSRYVAKRLGEALQDEVVSMNDYLRSGRQGAFQSETPYVFVTPTYAWRMPRVARAFLARAELSGSRDAYFVLTCGGAVGNAAADVAQLCVEKGLHFCGLQPVVMPDNYLVMFPVPAPDEAARIVRAAAPAIRQAADCIRAREPFPARRAGLGGRLLSALVNPLFYLQPQPRLHRQRRLHRLRAVRGALPARQHPFGAGPPRLRRQLHALHGVHLGVPGAGHRVWPRDARQAAPLSGGRRPGGRGVTVRPRR